MNKLSILIVDDQKLFAQSLKIVLSSVAEIKADVTVVNDGESAITKSKENNYDLIICDVWMPGTDGISVVQTIREKNKNVKIIMLSSYSYDKYFKSALREGANGYLLKDISPEELTKAIIKVLSGQNVIDNEIIDYMKGNIPPKKNTEYFAAIDKLTQREKEVLSLIGKGFSNEEIANKICLSEHTIRNYISSINDKLETNSRFEAMRLAIEHHIDSFI